MLEAIKMAEYCLRWNNHQPNLVTVFSELLNAEALVDVTLATDGHFIHAHKLVLSACSAYFKDLFRSNPCKHPIVFLKDIRIEDLKTVIDFIYRGEVNVSQERLQDVLKTAESLRIKGLADNRPFSYDEYPSHSRGQHLSSSFSSQRSSLTDSREQTQSVDADDPADSAANSPPATKKRKVASSQDSSESVQDANTNHDGEEKRGEGGEESTQKKNSSTTPQGDETASSRGSLKEEKEGAEADKIKSSDKQDLPESRAADAMLMLQGSSSEGGGEDGVTTPTGGPTTSIARSNDSTSITAHAQGRGKRGVLKRQPGIIREGATEGTVEEVPGGARQVPVAPEGARQAPSSPEYIVPDSITLTLTTDASSAAGNVGSPSDMVFSSAGLGTSGSKMLQVPAVVVGPHQESNSQYSSYGSPIPKQTASSKPLLVVPSAAGQSQMTKQRSQPEMSRSYSEGIHSLQVKKESAHPSVLSHTTASNPPPEYPGLSSTTQQQQAMALIPMQLIKKQRSSPGSLPSTSSHLRPIQPKPSLGGDKELPIIQFPVPTDEEGVTCQTRFPRAISEEPVINRSLDLLVPGGTQLTQSVSQDTGLDGGLAFANRIMSSSGQSLSVPKLSTGASCSTTPSSVAHSPVLREGPALGCNYCWNSQDNQGRVQRRKTKYHCPACRTNLCIVPCFHEYHSQIQMQQDQHKQFTKVLTKTSST